MRRKTVNRIGTFFILLISLISSTRSENISIQWGKLYWHSPTHVEVSLILTIPEGWKLYGEPLKGDTLQRPLELSWKDSHNILHVQVTWPPPSLWKEKDQRAHVYYKKVSPTLQIFLENRAESKMNMKVEGLLCSSVCQPFSLTTSLSLSPPVTKGNWLKMLFFAFLGGLILNAMPCVLPVLALKLRVLHSSLSFRKTCLFTGAGIIVGFWFLALLTLVLKIFFHIQGGWSMHLYSPLFLLSMIFIMIFSAYSLWGLFSLSLPPWFFSWLPKGSHPFLMGILAVFLATPCSAPFLGPAIGFALTGNFLEIIAFYTVIGLGFSLPYGLALILPIKGFLPQPGPWMIKVEKGMGLLFWGSAVWFMVWPLSAFIHPSFHFLLWMASFWWLALPLLKKILFHARLLNPRGWFLLYVLALFPIIILSPLPFIVREKNPSSVSLKDGRIQWLSFTPHSLDSLLKAGRTIFIDVTGMGCALCMVNKRVFLNEKIQKELNQSDVVCMRADYSHGAKDILLFLKRYGRAAIPFNMVLSQFYPKGIVLSEVLSVDEIQTAMALMRGLKKKALAASLKTSVSHNPQPRSLLSKKRKEGKG